MKRVALVALIAWAAGCGGGGGQGDQITASNLSPTTSQADPSKLAISSIQGDGSAADKFASALIIDGSNFAEGMGVELQGKSVTKTLKLSYTVSKSTQIKATLPSDLTEGNYDLNITKGTEKATASVTILKGETGAQGPAGPAGITMAAQFSCTTLSNDLDPSSSVSRKGLSTSVVKFSDGSYYLNCFVSYSDSSFFDSDTSSSSTWFASNSVGVTSGKISCVPMYVTAEYSISANTVTYVSQADSAQKQTLACTQVYP